MQVFKQLIDGCGITCVLTCDQRNHLLRIVHIYILNILFKLQAWVLCSNRIVCLLKDLQISLAN